MGSRIGRNPHKPEDTVVIPKRRVVKFKPGKEMKARYEGIVDSTAGLT
jgi:nucleoid DNA-binding protein